jgi:hypothetical protein
MLRRRRPLLRAAAIGGAGVAVGHAMAKNSAPAAEGPTPSAGTSADAVEHESAKMTALARLKEMLDQGVLTQSEFDSEKAKILQQT